MDRKIRIPLNFLFIFIFISVATSLNAQDDKKYAKQRKLATDWNTSQFSTLKKKENFRNGCDTAKMRITVLQTRFEANGGESSYGKTKLSKQQKEIDKIQATNVGVDGCGEKAVYIFSGAGWVLNSTDQKK